MTLNNRCICIQQINLSPICLCWSPPIAAESIFLHSLLDAPMCVPPLVSDVVCLLCAAFGQVVFISAVCQEYKAVTAGNRAGERARICGLENENNDPK